MWYLLWDNLNLHRNPEVRRWLFNYGITCMDFPTYSPDLNPIENLFADMKRRLPDRHATTIDELLDAVHDEWNATSINTLMNLAHDMPERCRKVISANGYKIGK